MLISNPLKKFISIKVQTFFQRLRNQHQILRFLISLLQIFVTNIFWGHISIKHIRRREEQLQSTALAFVFLVFSSLSIRFS
jgi:hypothetical protein